jgi:hypothetical protein
VKGAIKSGISVHNRELSWFNTEFKEKNVSKLQMSAKANMAAAKTVKNSLIGISDGCLASSHTGQMPQTTSMLP